MNLSGGVLPEPGFHITLKALGLSLSLIKEARYEKLCNINDIVNEFSMVFSDEMGFCTKGQFHLFLKNDAKPIFLKPRPLPYAIKEKVEKELNRLMEEKIIYPVESSEWATPFVPVLKKDGEIRICGDYKVTLNSRLKIDKYPIPRVQDVLATLNGGVKFSNLDLSHAYQQVELDEESQNLTTIATHKGLFSYRRLCFGVASAPGLFQRRMEQILSGIEGVVSFFDDILISGSTEELHNERLRQVLMRLKDAGFTARKEKCKIGVH